MFPKYKITIGLISILMVQVAGLSHGQAGCLKDCQSEKAPALNKTTVNQSMKSSNNTENSNKSHNRAASPDVGGNVKNAILGTMKIDVYNKTAVGNVGRDSTINNTVNSNIVLGDVQQ